MYIFFYKDAFSLNGDTKKNGMVLNLWIKQLYHNLIYALKQCMFSPFTQWKTETNCYTQLPEIMQTTKFCASVNLKQ